MQHYNSYLLTAPLEQEEEISSYSPSPIFFSGLLISSDSFVFQQKEKNPHFSQLIFIHPSLSTCLLYYIADLFSCCHLNGLPSCDVCWV